MKIASMKKEKAFDREAEPEHAAEGAGEVRPEQPQLEAEDRASDDAGREQRRPSASCAPAIRVRSDPAAALSTAQLPM